MQVGYVGLLKAINNYDPAFGNNLTAYASPCVSGEIGRFRDKRWQVHVRRSAQELLLSMRKASEDLTHQLGRQPTNEELTERLGVSLEDLLEAQQADLVFSAYSLDAPLSDHEDPGQLSDVLGDEDADLERSIDMEAVATHWDELPEREQKILTLRFYGNLTQAEIADQIGISQMHVSRLLSRALTHLRGRLLDADAPFASWNIHALERTIPHENRSRPGTHRGRRDPGLRCERDPLVAEPAHGRLGAHARRPRRPGAPQAHLRLAGPPIQTRRTYPAPSGTYPARPRAARLTRPAPGRSRRSPTRRTSSTGPRSTADRRGPTAPSTVRPK